MSPFTLTTDTERAAGFTAADEIRTLMDKLNRQDIPALCWERGDDADSVYSYLGRALEAIFRQLGLSQREAEQARMHTCDCDAQTAYRHMISQRPCGICQGSGYVAVCHASTDAVTGSEPCPSCSPF